MKVSGKGKRYMNRLGKDLKENGLKYPLTLTVSKLTGRAYLHDGNHRISVLKDLNVKWVPLKVIYFFNNDDHDPHYKIIPAGHLERYPDYPTPKDNGLLLQKNLHLNKQNMLINKKNLISLNPIHAGPFSALKCWGHFSYEYTTCMKLGTLTDIDVRDNFGYDVIIILSG